MTASIYTRHLSLQLPLNASGSIAGLSARECGKSCSDRSPAFPCNRPQQRRDVTACHRRHCRVRVIDLPVVADHTHSDSDRYRHARPSRVLPKIYPASHSPTYPLTSSGTIERPSMPEGLTMPANPSQLTAMRICSDDYSPQGARFVFTWAPCRLAFRETGKCLQVGCPALALVMHRSRG